MPNSRLILSSRPERRLSSFGHRRQLPSSVRLELCVFASPLTISVSHCRPMRMVLKSIVRHTCSSIPSRKHSCDTPAASYFLIFFFSALRFRVAVIFKGLYGALAVPRFLAQELACFSPDSLAGIVVIVGPIRNQIGWGKRMPTPYTLSRRQSVL